MSDILIKGMEIPKNCWECSLSDIDDDYGRCCLFSGIACLNIGRQDNCPLIEVKTPHGRLIDKDELRRKLFLNFNGERIPFYDCDNFPTTLTYRDLHSILAEQPTIIEAEGSE